MKKKRIIQVLIPCFIIIAVVAIYFTKNAPTEKKSEPSNQENSNVNSKNTDSMEDEFKLEQTEEVDFEKLTSYGLPIIVDYGSDSCIPCKEMAPVLEKLNEEMQGKAFIKFVDVWKYNDAADNVPIQVIPTQVLFHADGTPFKPSEKLSSQIDFVQYETKDTGEHVFTVHKGGLTEEEMRMILTEMGVTE